MMSERPGSTQNHGSHQDFFRRSDIARMYTGGLREFQVDLACGQLICDPRAGCRSYVLGLDVW